MPLDAFDDADYADMAPSMLASQPVSVPDKTKEKPDWQIYYSHLESSLNSMRSWRWSWWSHWSKLAEFFLPRRYTWLVVANRMNKGQPINDAIVDATGTDAAETCASGMYAGLTNPSRPWIKLENALPSQELDADGKAWIEATEERLYTVLGGSNFYQMMAQAFQDLTVFGTAPAIIYEDFKDVIRLYVPCAGEYYLRSSARQDTDTLYREFNMTTKQIVDMFQLKNCPPEIVKMWTEAGAGLDMERVVAHAIEPNFPLSGKDGNKGVRMVPGSFEYREIYWLRSNKTAAPLSVRGFNGTPFMALMWAKTSNDAYGRSPCMTALGDNKQLQMETRRKAEFIEKLVRPPMGADSTLKNEPTSIIPGMVTFMNTEGSNKKFFPLFEVAPQALAPMIMDIKDVQARIERTLFVDVFMAITRMEGVQPRNQLELTKRDLERLQKLGPVIDLVVGQLSIGIERILEIMDRRGILPPKPKSLQNIPLKIHFISLMRLAQKQAAAVAMKDTFAVMGALSSAAKAAGVPDPIRKINLDKSLAKYAEINDYPSDCVYTDDEVKQHDAERAQAKQQAEMPGQALAGVNAAKTLSETQVPGAQSALAALMGGAPAGNA